MSFEKLNLSQPILNALHKCGYTKPTPIQQQAIPRVLAGKDVIATAQTGTGKTAAFVLPILQYLLSSPKQALPRVLILTPTRELANQITDAVTKYGTQSAVKVVSILGGMPYQTQLRQLSRPVDILVATPGRLLDYINRNSVNLSSVRMLVLDEADRMLDMGFIDDVKRIAQCVTASKRQTLLFTATLNQRVIKLAQGLLRSPEQITVAGESVALESIEQRIYITDDKNHKDRLLEHLLNAENIYKAIIFSATKHQADKLARQLYEQGYAAGALHGDMNQGQRNRTLIQFRTDKIQLLVATDVAARGIDINDLTHVINYDIPKVAEDYVHRIGRTGRAGKSGIAISFVLSSENMQLKRIERFMDSTIGQFRIEGLEPKHTFKKPMAEKPKKFRGNRNKNGISANGKNRKSENFSFQGNRKRKRHEKTAD